jgi:hypothetical protein
MELPVRISALIVAPATQGGAGAVNDRTDWVLRLGYLIHDVSRLCRIFL